jgi:hypothetical protein
MQVVRKAFLLCFVLIFIANILVPKGALCITIQEEEEMTREVMKVI